MKDLLSRYDSIQINFQNGNGNWAQDIYLPAASSNYTGKIIHILHQAEWGSNLYFLDQMDFYIREDKPSGESSERNRL